jgi:hypothetical protein
LYVDNDWNFQIVKVYTINSIPIFILIDLNGNIVRADAAVATKRIDLFNKLKL